MAAPFKDPRTGIYYFRRIIPTALRPFFDGERSEYKRTLKTRGPEIARQRYHPHAVIYEERLRAARRALSNKHLRSVRAMVDAYLDGTTDLQLRGPRRLLRWSSARSSTPTVWSNIRRVPATILAFRQASMISATMAAGWRCSTQYRTSGRCPGWRRCSGSPRYQPLIQSIG
jgi:hypothetical protein